jgi:hypothetical protein
VKSSGDFLTQTILTSLTNNIPGILNNIAKLINKNVKRGGGEGWGQERSLMKKDTTK